MYLSKGKNFGITFLKISSIGWRAIYLSSKICYIIMSKTHV